MSRIRAFLAFWYDFVVGDDWRVAAGVVLALALTAGLAHSGVNAWWLLPVVVVALLGYSVHRASRSARLPRVRQRQTRALTPDAAAGGGRAPG